MSKNKNFLGKHILQELKKSNKTQLDLAQMTGLTPSTIHNVISGKSNKQSHIRDIAKALQIDTDLLLKGGAVIREPEFDIAKHKTVFNTVISLIEKEGLKIAKANADTLCDLLYYKLSITDLSQKEMEIYLQGMIDYGLEIGTIVKNY